MCRILYVYTDSQAAIKAINNPRRQSGQAAIKELILDHIEHITNAYPTFKITIVWIQGHSEIAENERVDEEAKKAARNQTISQPFKHSPLNSAPIQNIKKGA